MTDFENPKPITETGDRKGRLVVAIVTVVVCAAIGYVLLGKKNDHVFLPSANTSPRTLIHFTQNSDAVSGVAKPEKMGLCVFYIRSMGAHPATAQLVFEARFDDKDEWFAMISVPNPPADHWVGYRGPMLPQMRFRVAGWASGDGIEADLCENECPGPHPTKPPDPNQAAHP